MYSIWRFDRFYFVAVARTLSTGLAEKPVQMESLCPVAFQLIKIWAW